MKSFSTTYSLFLLAVIVLPVSLLAQQEGPLLLAGHGIGTRHASFSPDGSTVVSVGNNDTLHFWDASTGALVRSFRESRPGHSVFYRPDGMEVIRAGDSTLQARNALTGRMRLWFACDDQHTLRFAIYSPDGTKYLTLGADFTPEIWNAANGELIHHLVGHNAAPIEGRFSPDGSRIATVSNVDRTVRIWSVESGQEIARYTANSYAFSIDWTNDGKGILVTADSTILICDAATGALVRTIVEKSVAIEARFVGGDRYVVAGASDSSLTLYETGEGNRVRELPYREGFPIHIEVGPDRSRIVVTYTNGKLGLWELNLSSVSGPAVAGESHSVLRSLYPNPARDQIEVSFDLSHNGPVRLRLIDLNGREVALLAEREYEPGGHLMRYDLNNLPSGLYYCLLQTNGENHTRTLQVVR